MHILWSLCNVLTLVKFNFFNVSRASKMAVSQPCSGCSRQLYHELNIFTNNIIPQQKCQHSFIHHVLTCYLWEVWWTAGQSMFSSLSWWWWTLWCSRMSWHKVTDHMCHCVMFDAGVVFADRKRLLWAPPVSTHVPPTNTHTHTHARWEASTRGLLYILRPRSELKMPNKTCESCALEVVLWSGRSNIKRVLNKQTELKIHLRKLQNQRKEWQITEKIN